MSKYQVTWEEKLSVEVDAGSEEEAIEKIHSGDFDEGQVASEISFPPEAYLNEKRY